LISPLCMSVIISYKSPLWIKVGLRSFRRFFPGSPILIIDNNLDPGVQGYDSRSEVEREWIREWRSQDSRSYFVKTEFSNKNHGLALDQAVQWCKGHGVRWMLPFEPDCLINGVEWANRLLEATTKDIWMAGSHLKSYGPIHPTPSIWDVGQIQSSFREQPRGSDMNHPRFHELMNMKDLMAHAKREKLEAYWAGSWDTAQKPWFDAAIHDKALLVEPTPDFEHFWNGSTTDPSKIVDSRVTQYL
jgi:hypothetical protein